MTVRTQHLDLPGLAPTRGRPFGLYIHVPFCATRCGYCDFNTYTPAELGGANPDGWLAALRTELALAAGIAAPEVHTVFVGGGTPSLLGAAGLTRVLDAVREHFVLAPGAELTTEANPESTSPQLFTTLCAAGYTRGYVHYLVKARELTGMRLLTIHNLAYLQRLMAELRDAIDENRLAAAAAAVRDGAAPWELATAR